MCIMGLSPMVWLSCLYIKRVGANCYNDYSLRICSLVLSVLQRPPRRRRPQNKRVEDNEEVKPNSEEVHTEENREEKPSVEQTESHEQQT